MNRRFFTMFVLLVAQGLVMALPAVAVAQAPPSAAQQAPPKAYPDPQIALPPASLKDFDTVLPLIARQGHVALVCEAQPLHLTLPPSAAAALAQRLDPAGTPLEETVKQVAAAYDYDAQRLSADTFLLTKRYTDKADLPDVTFEEVLASLQNIVTATQDYCLPPPSEEDKDILDILRDATPDQRAQLAQGVPISQLPVASQQIAWQFALRHSFNDLLDLVRVVQRLKACKDRETVFCRRRYFDFPFTAYQGAFGPNGTMDYFALSSWVDTQNGGGQAFIGAAGVTTDNNARTVKIAPGTVEPTAPDGPVLPVSGSRLRLTLAGLARQLSKRPAQGGMSVTQVQIDAALARKTLCLTGGEAASSDDLIRAVCAMYGLERHDAYTMDATTLEMPHPEAVTEVSKIKAEVARLLPGAFVRAVSSRATDPQNTTTQVYDGIYSSLRSEDAYIASLRRLRGVVEPLLAKSADHQLPVPDAGNEARDLVALVSIAKCTGNFQALAFSAPTYFDNFSRSTLKIAVDEKYPDCLHYRIADTGGQGKATTLAGIRGYPVGTLGPLRSGR